MRGARFWRAGSGFNRDIVECKDHELLPDYAGQCGFNRDIVECKDIGTYFSDKQAAGFNRDIVECKGHPDL